jgi:hypothetical protein
MKKIVGEGIQNSLIAYRIQSLADAMRDSERYDESEKLYREAQTIIGCIWGEDHPYILQYNGNLITTLNIKMTHQEGVTEAQKEELKVTLKNIIKKNYEIAEKTYGTNSIHFIFYIS